MVPPLSSETLPPAAKSGDGATTDTTEATSSIEIARSLHFIGMAGAGMSALAELALHLGLTVSGSDAKSSAILDRLQEKGATVYTTQTALNIKSGSTVIASSAIKETNPELHEAKRLHLPIWHRSDLLQTFLEGSHPGFEHTVGISGTHGKTTLTGMVGGLLEATGLDPTIVAGGKLPGQESNVRCGKKNAIAVAELDESDGTLVKYAPTVTIVSNIELDHADHYASGLEGVKTTFATFFKGLGNASAKDGKKRAVILNADCSNSREVAFASLPEGITALWLSENPSAPIFGNSKQTFFESRYYTLESITPTTLGYTGNLVLEGKALATVETTIPGKHNLFNAAQALLVAHWLQQDLSLAGAALQQFSGMGRRFERVGTLNKALLVDDYAHHPTEVIVTLQAARQVMEAWAKNNGKSSGRVLAIFQAHRYSRLQTFWDDFAQAFQAADMVYVLDVYSAGETPIEGINGKQFAQVLGKQGKLAHYIPDFEAIYPILTQNAQSGDVIITLGAGDITQLLRKHPLKEPLLTEGSLSNKAPIPSMQTANKKTFKALEPQQCLAAPYSTYRIGGLMQEAYFPDSLSSFEALAQQLGTRIADSGPPTIIGWGSNSLIASQGISGVTILTRKMSFIEPLEGNRFRIGAGTHLAQVASMAVEKGLQGAEFFIGIPGTMGGAVKMNAGAMGQESASIIERVLVYDWESRSTLWLNAEGLAFAYRYSKIDPDRQLILAVDCVFKAGDISEAKARMQQNMAFRKAHHPTAPNGGSVFRNPEGGPAVGQMLDALGAKGVWQEGQAQVSALHGNFIVNLGQATSTDVLRLMLRMKQAVAQEFGHTIYPENRFLGDATEEEQALWRALKGQDAHD